MKKAVMVYLLVTVLLAAALLGAGIAMAYGTDAVSLEESDSDAAGSPGGQDGVLGKVEFTCFNELMNE